LLRKGDGDVSREGEVLISAGSKLEHDGVGDGDFEQSPCEMVV
jgi:hypothetical protein